MTFPQWLIIINSDIWTATKFYIVPQTVLALWGSGGIKAGEGNPPARALAFTKKVAVAAVPCILAQKVSFPLQS